MIFPTGENADLQQWKDDALIECHNDDALWGLLFKRMKVSDFALKISGTIRFSCA